MAGRLYAVIDACDRPDVPAMCARLGRARALALYTGEDKRQYWAISPYVVVVDERLLDVVIEEFWSEAWGIFVVSGHGFRTVARHLRRFLTVQAPDGDLWYFRFYDPRVLPDFLATGSASQLREWFRHLDAVVVPEAGVPSARLVGPARGRTVRTLKITSNTANPRKVRHPPEPVSREQLTALQRLVERRTEGMLARHMEEHFPEQCAALAPGELEHFVKAGIARAWHHGFEAPAHVCGFLILMFCFGREFAVGPDPLWAHAVLTARRLSAGDRITLLMHAAERALDEMGNTSADQP